MFTLRLTKMKTLSNLLSVAVPALLCTAPVSAALPTSVQENNWQLVFADDFSGSSLDTSKWNRINYVTSWIPSETSWMYHQSEDESLVTVDNGSVKFSGKYGDYENQAKIQGSIDENAMTYACGGIDTSSTFSFKYGYVEVRACMTGTYGAWPAIWMMPLNGNTWPSSGEIDIMEHLGTDKSVYQTLHHTDTSKDENHGSTGVTPSYASGTYWDWHTYGMEWTEDHISFYLDGALTGTMYASDFTGTEVWPFGADSKEFYLIMDQQITTVPSWQTGLPSSTTALSASQLQYLQNNEQYMLVDYVNVYSSEDYMHNVPEPTTATLSLLALAGLAVRRRRR